MEGYNMKKEETSFRLSDDDIQAIRTYQQARMLPTKAMAVRQMIRTGWQLHKYLSATDSERKTGQWYEPPTDFTQRTIIDEMDDKQRDTFLRSFGHNFADKLGYNNDNNKNNSHTQEDDGGLDDIF